MKVIPGPASRELGLKVAELLGAGVVPIKHKLFPDGESYLRIDGPVEGEAVAIIQSTYPPQDKHLVELCLLADAAKDLGARRVVAVVPYMAYARQDKRFLPGEAVSVWTAMKLLRASGVDKLVTVDIHDRGVLERAPMEAADITAVPLLADYVVGKGLSGALAIAPDEGAVWRAEGASAILGGGFGWLYKERDLETGEIRRGEGRLDVAGRAIVIFDDIISTGGTIASAAKMLRERGASLIYAACTHPLLLGDALKRILSSGCDGVIGTDSVPSQVSVVSIAPLIARELEGEV